MKSNLCGYGVELKRMSSNDLELVRGWRNHPSVSQFMIDRHYITSSAQILWFDSIQNSVNQLHYLIYYKDEAIGIINAKSGKSAETVANSHAYNNADKTVHKITQNLSLYNSETIIPGLYLSPTTAYKNTILAFSPSLLLIDTLFSETACKRLLAQVLPDNQSAIRYNQTLGYTDVIKLEQQTTEQEYWMELDRSNYAIAKDKLLKVLRF